MNGSFIFGSEIKSFLEHPEFKKELNEEALAHYLSFQYSPCEETFFKNVYKLPPAHYFTIKDGKMEKVRYWRPEFESTDGAVMLSISEASPRWQYALCVVDCRLRGDSSLKFRMTC